jgi:F-type H+-transporting ATPase subunit gamma
MSNTLASLRHKITGAEQLGSVVRAMKAVAASSIGQYEAAVDALGDYQRSVELGLSLCLREDAAVATPAFASAASRERPIGALIFGSDQGLVGRFNEVIGISRLEFCVSFRDGRRSGWSANGCARTSRTPVWS